MDKGKGKAREEEIEDFVSEEAYSNWKKYYANKGFIAERRFRNPITPFKEMIEQRGWKALCAHQKSDYTAVVKDFYSNLVGRKTTRCSSKECGYHMEPRPLTKPTEWQGTSMGPSSKSSWKTQISRRLLKSSLKEKHN